MNRVTLTSNEKRRGLLDDLSSEVRRHQNAQDAFDETACRFLGINRTDGRCLDIIDQHGRVSAGELAREARLSTGAVTTLLDRLERVGYVQRIRDTEDRRKVFVELTDEARRRAAEIWGPIAEEAQTDLDHYSDEELETILGFLRGGREFLTRHLWRVEAMARDRT